jgi:hypothetical protein
VLYVWLCGDSEISQAVSARPSGKHAGGKVKCWEVKVGKVKAVDF